MMWSFVGAIVCEARWLSDDTTYTDAASDEIGNAGDEPLQRRRDRSNARADGAQLASFSRRAIAFTLDLVIGYVLFRVLFVVVLLIRRLRVDAVTGRPGDDPVELNFFENWYSILWWVLYFGLATYLWNGRTPGKRLLRIRVVSLVHRRLDLWHSIERALGYAASALELGFGFLQYFVHPNHRTVHDRIAETIVISRHAAFID